MAKKMGTWLASVKEAGSIITRIGITIGIVMAIAVSKAVTVSFSVFVCLIMNNS